MNTPRKGFDVSPLLNQRFEQASNEYLKGIAPERVNEDPEHIPELLIHTVKRIHKAPTPLMVLEATRATGLNQKQVIDVWNAMWERA